MKAKDLRERSTEDLAELKTSIEKDLFSHRMKNATDQLGDTSLLGKARICQIHLKDNPNYMGEGTIDFAEVVNAIRDVGFSGYCNLETDTKPGSTVEADMRKNLAFIRREIDRA